MNTHTSIPAGLILLLAFSLAGAGEIFTWVDASGITHFSETAPDEAATGVAEVELPPAPTGVPDTGENYYSVINQAARMEARRLENEKLRAERLQAEAEARKARAEEQAALEAARQAASLEEPRYYPLYTHYPRYGHRPWKHRPRHPDRHYRDTGRRNYFRSRRNDPVW
jgi:hypothetical protein